MGFADAARAEVLLLNDLGTPAAELRTDPVVAAIAAAADPDLALTGMARLFAAAGPQRRHPHKVTAPRKDALRAALRAEQDFRERLIAVLGVSAGLADHLARHPEDAEILRGTVSRPDPAELRADMLRAVGADPDDPESPTAAGAEPVAALAAAYRRRLLHLAARDLTGVATVDVVGEELADIAAAVLEAALAVARAELPPGAAPCRLAVVAMGKCGGRELNYASDVDVIFVAEPVKDEDETAALGTASRLAAGLIGVCARSTPEGSIFPVDPNLRPEGRAGPLVRSLTSHLAYYERWAKTWEFQALLKARPVAGDMTLGQAYANTLGPLVWQAARREHFVEDVQAMRRRVEQSLPARQAGRELKLGPGGLRDIEFAVQLLQLVHGRTDETLRSPATLPALAALAVGGYVGRADAEELGAAYRFLRRTEHLLQLGRLSRTHTLPEDPVVLRRLGRAMRFNDGPNEPWFQASVTGIRSDPAVDFDEEWRRHARQVRRLHEKLFYRPLLDAVARLPSDAARLTPAEARARLEALGYVDPAGALHHIDALTSGVSRRAAIQRTLLPVLLGWFADAAEPDAGLLAFRQVSEELGSSPWYLRLLRDETKAAERMAHVLASSRYAAGLLLRAPEAVAIFGNDAELKARSLTGLRGEMMAATQRYEDDAEGAVTAVRSVRRRELLRTAAAELCWPGGNDPPQTPPAASVSTGGTHPPGPPLGGTHPPGPPLGGAARPPYPPWEGGCRAPRTPRARLAATCGGAYRYHPGVDRGRAGGGAAEGLRRAARPAADPVRGDRDGPLRRSRGRLRQRRRRAVRARPAAGPAGAGGLGRRARGGGGAAAAAHAAGSRPGPDRGRRPAAGGPPGTAGAHAGGVPGLLPALVRAVGGAGAAARRAGRGRRRPRREVHPDDRRVPLPAGRDQRGGRPRDPPHQGADGSRTDSARRRPGAARQAGAGRPVRRGVDDPAAAAAARPRAARAAHHPYRCRHGGRGAGWPAGRRRRRRTDRGVGARRPDQERDHAGPRPAGDTLPAKHSELTAVARLLGYPPGDAAQALEQDYRRAARRARTVMEPLFYG